MVGLALLAMFSNNNNLVAPGVIMFLVGMVMVAPALVRPVAFAFGKLLVVIYARQGIGELAQGNLIRHPSRAAVTASATMLGLAVIVAAGGVVTSLTGTLSDVMKKSLDSDYLFIPPSIALWSSNVGAGHELVDRLRALDGVAEVSSMRFAGSVVSAAGAQSNGSALPGADGKSVSLLGIDPIVFPKVGGLYFQQGDESAYQEMLKGHVMIVNGAFITTTGAKVGDQVELVTPGGKASYRIAAVATDALNAKITTAFITQTDMLADFGSAEDVFIQLNLKPGADIQAADRQIKAIATDYPQFQVIAGKVYYQQIDGEINGVFAGLYFILVLLALPALIAMLNTLAIGVIERTREIGMLRAVGATKKQIRTMVVTEALLLAGIGTAFGILCGLYLGYVFVNALEPIFPLGYYFPLAGILVAISMGLIFGALASIIPARQAARMNVVDALKYE
jgi:putative ABC transport system permease protein